MEPRATRLLQRLRGGRGQSLAEFAVILPILMLIVLGTVDFGRAYFTAVSVTNAARTGADYAAVSSTNANDLPGIEAAVLEELSSLGDSDEASISVTTSADGYGGTYAEVTVTHTFETAFPWPGIPNSVDIQRTSRARVQ